MRAGRHTDSFTPTITLAFILGLEGSFMKKSKVSQVPVFVQDDELWVFDITEKEYERININNLVSLVKNHETITQENMELKTQLEQLTADFEYLIKNLPTS